jgi:hypothetical protein
MDRLEYFIEIKDFDNINKEVNDLIIGGYKKKEIINYIIYLYCDRYINKNIWVLKELHKHIQESENKDVDINKLLSSICIIISLNTKKSLHLYSKDEKVDIREILFSNTYLDLDEVNEFKDILNDDIYGLLNIICGNLKRNYDMLKTFTLVKYILNCSRKKCFKIKTDMDPVDILFLIMMKLDLDNIIKTFVFLCKDLFYYRSTKKEKITRINLLFYSIFIIINKNVINKQYDYKNLLQDPSTNKNNYDYLFMKFEYDSKLKSLIDKEKASNIITTKYKDVNYKSSHVIQHNINIILTND